MRESNVCGGLLAAVLLAATLSAGPGAAQEPEPVTPRLTPKLQGLLVQEMNAVLAASQEILGALVRGEDAVVAEKAQAVHDSFIMQQQMTEQDRKDLMQAVPQAFVERDRAFHQLTGELAGAARAGDRARQHDLFAHMVEACSACHARYATDRFPELKGAVGGD